MKARRRAAIKHPITGAYLNLRGEFTSVYVPGQCQVIVHESEGAYKIEHARFPRFLKSDLTWEEVKPEEATAFSARYDEEDFVNYLQVKPGERQIINQEAEVQVKDGMLEFVLEDREENPVNLYPIGNFQPFNDQELEALHKATSGGKNLKDFIEDQVSESNRKEMQMLMEKISKMTPEEADSAWVNARTINGTEIKYIKYGTAKIICAPQQKLSKKGAELAEKIRAKNANDPDYKEVVEVVYIFKSGKKSTFQTLLSFTGFAATHATIAALIVSGVNYTIRRLVLRGIAGRLSIAAIEGLEAAMTQELWYVRFTSFLASGGWGSVASACLVFIEFVVVMIALYYLTFWLYKPQYLTTQLFNLSKHDLAVSLPYTSNVEEYIGENDPTEPYTLPAMAEAGDWIYDEDFGWIETKDTVVFGTSYFFENDNKWMEGFSMLYGIMRTDGVSNAFAKISIPWSSKNEMGAELDVYDDNYKEIWRNMSLSASEALAVQGAALGVSMAIDALTGNDNQYNALIQVH